MATLRAHLTLVAAASFVLIAGCGEGRAPDAANTSASGDVALSQEMALAPMTSELGVGPGLSELGEGPGQGGDKYDLIVENAFVAASTQPVSTFSIDVDTASYAKMRMFLLDNHRLPPADAVRIEELINYFPYNYHGPRDEHPFAANVEVATCPWAPQHRLVQIGIKGQEVDRSERPRSNLVFLLDVSGSMSAPNKLPLLKRGMKMLVDQLGENDQVAIVVYASAVGLVLPATSCDQKQTILDALEHLHAGGSTNGGRGVQLAYQVAMDHYIPGGTNRVILCTDGDFNVGTTSTSELVNLVQDKARDDIQLTVLGFGMGNHNDAMLEQISNRGNGNYAFIDTDLEARKVLVEQMSGTLLTIAKDVKIQVEFNPVTVQAYRLIGYENRLLATEDFNNDKIDAGEIGAGHTVTALYEIVPVGVALDVAIADVDPLRYQTTTAPTEAAEAGELFTLKIRYKPPQGQQSKLMAYAVTDRGQRYSAATADFKFAAAVASFGMLLRDSQYKGDTNYDAVLELAAEGATRDPSGYRTEFISLVQQARQLSR